jgi:hypothetical protein
MMSVLVATAYMDEASRFDWLACSGARYKAKQLCTGETVHFGAHQVAGVLHMRILVIGPLSVKFSYPLRVYLRLEPHCIPLA